MKLQTDPKVVARLAEEREDANWRFRRFLKGVDLEIEELDAIVHEHYEDVASQTVPSSSMSLSDSNLSFGTGRSTFGTKSGSENHAEQAVARPYSVPSGK